MVQVLTFPRPPVPAPKSATWRMAANTQTHTSPLDQTVQTIELPGARWMCDATWAGLNPTEWRAFESFLAQLRGAAGRFYYWPPHAWAPRGNAFSGTPVVHGANQLGPQLQTRGWTPNAQFVVRAGDYFAVDNALGGRELKIIRSDNHADASGLAWLVFDPPLRRSPLDGAPIMLDRPTAIMRLASDDQGAFDHEEGGFASVALQLVEVF
jgi:hypothetical protein